MNVLEQLAPRSDGLSRLQALLASGQRPGILDTLDYPLTEIESHRAVFTASFAEATLTDSAGKIIATATATLLVFERR